jgi:hypothetical protein
VTQEREGKKISRNYYMVDSSTKDKVNSLQYRHTLISKTGKKKYYYQIHSAGKSAENSSSSSKNYVKVIMKTGSTYTGEVNSNNERHGYGVYNVIYGGVYDGYWKNGFKHGIGTFFFRGGTIPQYQGDWECGEPHGTGKVFNKEGLLKYDGYFKNGKSSEGVYWLDYKEK